MGPFNAPPSHHPSTPFCSHPVQERFDVLNKNLEATDAELAKVSLVQGSLQAEVQALEACHLT